MRPKIIYALLIALLSLIAAQPAEANDLFTYQGRLSDANGVPVPNGNYGITFSLYSSMTGGYPLWTDYISSVPTMNGLFSVVLGSQTPLDFETFGQSDLYLEIQIGPSDPISPRTLLTSSPRAAVASKLFGDVQTSDDGTLFLRNDNGDSSMVMNRSNSHAAIRLFDPQPEPPGKPIVDISSDLSLGASIKLFDPQPEPPGKTLELLSGVNTGPSILMFDPDPDPPTSPRFELSSSADLGASIKMFDPQPEPPGKLFDLTASAGSGPSMGFFDQGGQVMGVEPSPFNEGFSIKLFDPQPEPPGKLFEISTSYAFTKSTTLNMFAEPLGAARQEVVTLSANSSTAELRMGLGAPAGMTESLVRVVSDGSESRIEVAGPGGGPTATPPISMISNITSAMVGVGTNTPNYNLDVRGTIGNNTTLYHSDRRWKKDIKTLEGSLDKVLRLRGVKYRWRRDEYPDMNFPNGDQIGLVAQEVEKVIPEVVDEAADGYKSIDYAKLVSVLIESVKEQQKQIQALSKRVEELEGIRISSR